MAPQNTVAEAERDRQFDNIKDTFGKFKKPRKYPRTPSATGTQKLSRERSAACKVTIERPETAFTGVFDPYRDEVAVSSVQFKCKQGYTTDGRAPNGQNTVFTVPCGPVARHQGCLPVPCGAAFVLSLDHVAGEPGWAAKLPGEAAAFTASEGWSLSGTGASARELSVRLECTTSGWELAPKPSLLGIQYDGSSDLVTGLGALPLACRLRADEAERMGLQPSAGKALLHESLRVECVEGHTFGYKTGSACGNCPVVLEQARNLPCELAGEKPVLSTAGLTCEPVKCEIPAAAREHTAPGFPRAEGAADVLQLGQKLTVQCGPLARPAGDAAAPNEPYTVVCGEQGLNPGTGWCESIACAGFEGGKKNVTKRLEGAKREVVCPAGQSENGAARVQGTNDGLHRYECREKDGQHAWQCIKGRHCGALARPACRPVECPLPAVSEEIVFAEAGAAQGAVLTGSVSFRTAVVAACPPGFDLSVQGTRPKGKRTPLRAAQGKLWADLGSCTDQADFDALGTAQLVCKPTEDYCARPEESLLQSVGVREKVRSKSSLVTGGFSYADVAKGGQRARQSLAPEQLRGHGHAQCLPGYHFTGAFSGLPLGGVAELTCEPGKPGKGGGVWRPTLGAGALGSEAICAKLECAVPAEHESGAVPVGGARTVEFGEEVAFACPEGQVMVDRSYGLAPTAKGVGACSEASAVTGQLAYRGFAGLKCVPDCRPVASVLPLGALGLKFDGAQAVSHFMPESAELYRSLAAEHGSAYGSLALAGAEECLGEPAVPAWLRCSAEGAWELETRPGVWLTADELVGADGYRAGGLAFLAKHGVQMRIQAGAPDYGLPKGPDGRCFANKGGKLTAEPCDELSLAQRFAYPHANSPMEEPGVIVSLADGQCLVLADESGQEHSAANLHGRRGGRDGALVLRACGTDWCAAMSEEEKLCERGALARSGADRSWEPDPDCPFFLSRVFLAEPEPAEMHANFRSPCIDSATPCKRSKRAGGLGSIAILGSYVEASARVRVSYRGDPDEDVRVAFI